MEDSQTDYGNFEYEGKEYGEPPTAEEAQTEIDRVMKAAAKDSSHDYTNLNSMGHADEVLRVQRLYSLLNPEPEKPDPDSTIDSQVSRETAKAMQTALDEHNFDTEDIQEKLVSEFEDEASRLEELGFDSTRMPDKVMPYQIRALKEQRLFTEATENENKLSWEEFKTMIRQDFQELKNTPYAPNPQALELLNGFLAEADIDYLPTKRLAEALFSVIYEMRKPAKKTEGFDDDD